MQPDSTHLDGTYLDCTYLDYNATAPLLPAARQAMVDALARWPGNPSSPHQAGQAARSALEDCRARIAALLGLARREIIFTSGGSEANNLLLRGMAAPGAHYLVSPLEHPSVLETCAALAGQGVVVEYLPVNADGVVDVAALPGLLCPETVLVSVMTANNETGVVQPIAALTAAVRAHQGERHIVVHTDAVQAFGRIPVTPADWDVDAMTLAAHKLGGPKGIGALALRGNLHPRPQITGGRQERDLRAGTESVFLAAGFASAAEEACAQRETRMGHIDTLRRELEQQLLRLSGTRIHGAGATRLPNTVNVGISGVAAESLVIALDLQGIAVSTGSACSSGALAPSHVLLAMGLSEHAAREGVRISLGWATTAEDTASCAAVLVAEAVRLRERNARAAS
jgi:cysteine desulfurase